MTKIYVIMPAFNEGKSIKKVIRDIKKENFKNIIVVDDGSTDNTYSIAKSEKVLVVRHLINRGKGAATQTGFDAAKILDADIVVTIDADGQHNPKEIIKLVKLIKNYNYDVVLGSRFLNSKNKIPFIKRIINILGNVLIFFLYGIYCSDTQSGFRAYNKKAIKLIKTTMDRYEFESEIIGLIKKFNLKYKEIPISVQYTKYSMEKYKNINIPNFTPQKISNSFKMLFKLIINSIIK